MHLIGALQEHFHSPTSKTRQRSGVKSSASVPQSALQFTMLTLWTSSINTALLQSSGHREMQALVEVTAKQQAYGVPLAASSDCIGKSSSIG